eukprot:7391611-Prymnesium_polylepis.4
MSRMSRMSRIIRMYRTPIEGMRSRESGMPRALAPFTAEGREASLCVTAALESHGVDEWMSG